jgi:HD-like signal output (HDOD) protein
MIRAVIFLLIAGAVVALIMTLFRRLRGPQEHPVHPGAAQGANAPPPALAAPSEAGAGPVLSVDEVLHKLNELAFARTLTTSAGGHDEIMAAVTAALETAANEPKYAPRRPMLLPQLMKAVNDTDTSRRELSIMISRDPSLVGSLLKLANSPLYRTTSSQPIESVDRAVAVIGTEGIRSLIAAALVQPVFRVSGGEFSQFPEVIWDHTFLAANAAETYAAVVVNSDPFAAQLLALVNGLGAIIVFRVALDQYAAHPGFRPDAATIVSLLDLHTSRVARSIAASWELSGRILAALEDQVPGAAMAPDPTPLGRALRFGRFIAALAVLRNKGLIDEPAAKASLRAGGGSGAHFERIWDRLTGKPPAQAKPPEKSIAAWKT